jgi:galactonate dehydratase
MNLDTRLVKVNHRGDWLHVILTTEDGLTGFGEASHGGFGPNRDSVVEAVLRYQVAPLLADAAPGNLAAIIVKLHRLVDGLASATAVSGTEQALQDIAAKMAGVPVAAMFGDAAPAPVPLYANINRSVQDRTPETFATQARRVVAEGFTRIKIAPFDGIDQRAIRVREQQLLVQRGIDCAAAVRDAVGFAIDLMIDCHSAFDPATAVMVARELANLGVTWFEEPLPLTDIGEYVALRREVHRLGMEMVGGELLFGVRGFLPWLQAGAFDVVMPDVKHCGGLSGLRAIGETAAAFGVAVAPHNPSGPLATIASGHALAALPGHRPLEIAWGEVDWRNQVVGGAERIDNGQLVLPSGAGFGVNAITDPNWIAEGSQG